MTAPGFAQRTTAPETERVRATDVALLVGLRAAGVPATGILRLVQLRAARRGTSPRLDGFVADPRARFARWLYERGRLQG